MLITLSGSAKAFSEAQPENAMLPMLLSAPMPVTLSSFPQSLKTPFPMLLIPSGNAKLFKLAQPEKALSPIVLRLSGVVILLRAVQFLKASTPMSTTLSETTRFSRPALLSKAFQPILSTTYPPSVSGIVKSPTYVSSKSVIVAFPFLIV